MSLGEQSSSPARYVALEWGMGNVNIRMDNRVIFTLKMEFRSRKDTQTKLMS